MKKELKIYFFLKRTLKKTNELYSLVRNQIIMITGIIVRIIYHIISV